MHLRQRLGLLLGLGLLPLARAQQPAGELTDDPTRMPAADMLAVLFEDVPPYSFLGTDGRPQGYSIELATELCRRARLRPRFESSSWTRIYARGQSQPNVLLATMARLPEREPQFHWLGPTALRRAHLYRLKSRPEVQVQELDAAKRYLIAVIKDDAAERELMARGFELGRHLDRSPDYPSMLRKLFAGRNDLIALNSASAPTVLRRYGHEISQIEPAIKYSETSLYMGLSRTSSEATFNRLQQAFESMRKDGWLGRLHARYPVIAPI